MSQELYQTVLLIAGGVNLLLALVLLLDNGEYRDYDVYRRARSLVALCYAVFAVGFLLHAHFGWRTSWPDGATALSTTYFHVGAVLFGWSHTSLLRPDYLRRSIVVRDTTILIIGIAGYWTTAVWAESSLLTLHASLLIFFLHAGYIAVNFYRTCYLVRRSLQRKPVGSEAPFWWTEEAKREVLDGHHSFVVSAHLIILFGIGGIVVTASVPTLLWPFTLLMAAGIAVFMYIFYSLAEYGRVIEAATCATEDAGLWPESDHQQAIVY